LQSKLALENDLSFNYILLKMGFVFSKVFNAIIGNKEKRFLLLGILYSIERFG